MGKLLPFLMIAHKSSFWVYLTNVALYAVDDLFTFIAPLSME